MPKKQEEEKFYLGNKNLHRPDQEFEWTPKMVRDLKKCRQNILYFAENYFYIVNLDRGKEKIKLHACQKRTLRDLRDMLISRYFHILADKKHWLHKSIKDLKEFDRTLNCRNLFQNGP